MASNTAVKVCVWLFSVAGAGLLVLSCGSRYWQTLDSLGWYEGSWQYCTALGCSDIKLYSDGENELNATRALMVLGILLIAITMFIDMIGICCRKNLAVAMLILQIIAVACVAGGLGLYTKKLEKPLYDWGWSYMVGWAGVGVYVIAFLLVGVLVCSK